MQIHRHKKASIIIFIVTMICSQHAEAQTRSGGAFLQFIPGARHQGMANSLTGSIDNLQSFHINPAATGFIREWQWSSTYTEWFADSYNLSLVHGREFILPWHKKLRAAFGLQYQGIREFDSTNRDQPSASANDVLVTASLANPVNLLSKNLSFGMNLKYFRSSLAEFSASTWVYDFGALYRSQRFELRNPLFNYAILSGGLSVTNLGKPLTFINTKTPLPRTFQAGVAANIGTHSGLQFQLALDYQKVRDKKAQFSIGTEITWNYRVALRGGYNFNQSSLNKFSFGLSFRLDDGFSAISTIPGRNKALQVDVAAIDKREIFAASYHASVNLYPIVPNNFDLVYPLSAANLTSDEVEFIWTHSEDPDLYDEVNYILVLEKLDQKDDTTTLADLAKNLTGLEQLTKTENSNYIIEYYSPAYEQEDKAIHYTRKGLEPGDYVWTVIAYDKDDHIRFANYGADVGRFRILPDLELTELNFKPNSFVTDSDFQGNIQLQVKNNGKAQVDSFYISLSDSLFYAENATGPNLIKKLRIDSLAISADTTISIPWRSTWHGKHRLTAAIDPDNLIQEDNENNNTAVTDAYTIPNGYFKAPDVMVTQIDSLYEYELPFIPKVYFEFNSAEVERVESSLIYSPLYVLSERLKASLDLKIKLRGYVDRTNGEPESLALQRARAVQKQLLDFGVEQKAIIIHESSTVELPSTDVLQKSSPDTRWLSQERRIVKLTAIKGANPNREVAQLFYSVPVILPKSKIFLPLEFESAVNGIIPLDTAFVELYTDAVSYDTLKFNALNTANTITWMPSPTQRKSIQDQPLKYKLTMIDTLGRRFATAEKQVLVKTEKRNLLNDKIIIGVAEFRQDKPEPNLNWSNVAERLNYRLRTDVISRLNFVGHACAIGDSVYNAKLARLRAENFYTEFVRRYPDLAAKIKQQFNDIGIYGEGENKSFNMKVDKKLFLETLRLNNLDEFQKITYELISGKKYYAQFPFTFQLNGDQSIIIASDNKTPFGRQINRRIEIFIERDDGAYPRFTKMNN